MRNLCKFNLFYTERGECELSNKVHENLKITVHELRSNYLLWVAPEGTEIHGVNRVMPPHYRWHKESIFQGSVNKG